MADLVAEARRLAAETRDWRELSNALFDPHCGILALAYPSRVDRSAFVRSAEFAEIRAILEAKRRAGCENSQQPSV